MVKAYRDQEKHPRLRGEDRVKLCNIDSFRGNTPACAGKTPRKIERPKPVAETPPLARGRLHKETGEIPFTRNTPACAGKTDNPRHERGIQRETPPLARGRRSVPLHAPAEDGNTPACAGKTQHYEDDEVEI